MTTVAGAVLAGIAATTFFAGCGRNPGGPGAAGMMMNAAPEVGVVTVAPESVALTTELPGRIDPVRVAQVRARVDGIVLRRYFQEGASVTNGEVLYQIDPAPFLAASNSASASLAKAEANAKQAQTLADRYQPLVAINAVSKQDYDNAVSAAAQANADVLAAGAALETATINLGYTKVTSPIDGRIGAALVTEGALVSQAAATEMAVVTELDPIYCDFTESSTELLRLRREMDSGALKSVAPGEAKVTLLLDDGTTYSQPGKLLFSDVTVDPSSGMVTLRAEFPNPDHLLLPGMFARGRLEQAVDSKAITVLQRGVNVGANGVATVMVVGADGKVEARVVKLGQAVGNKWIVTGGLNAGESVIVEGLQKIGPGMAVKPVPFNPSGGGASAPAAPAPKN
ncbi:MAG TPA: efflux RND transporter periplasmic adaptor subunit [Candidatus Paceibacterota bacterium]|nr:efflux RND transporter periplasmic adaptor subunit [Candidatus Paceibacterota bacterium]